MKGEKTVELGSIIGFALGMIFLIVSIILPDFDFSKIIFFLDLPSLMIVVGGSFASLFIGYSIPKLLISVKAAKNIFKPVKVDSVDAIQKVISLANLARKEGILALEDAASTMEDKFLKKGIALIVDGTDPELVRNILETEMVYIEGRHKEVRGFWEYLALLGPSWGMMGTMVGLIVLLQNLDDPDQIGPSMSIAMITTMYGSLVANYIGNPIAAKLKAFSNEEMLMKEVLIEGVLSIQAGENPRIIEEKLKAFLAPSMRELASADAKQAGDE